ncbi:Rad1/Rec1/Rad17, partial [Baffinella frigidus]
MPDALQEAYVVAESSGLRFTVQKHNCLQMHVYLKRELFNVLECDAKHEFGINLTLLLECLNIFQTSTNFVALQISYAGEGKPLLLVMTDSGVVSKGGIHTQEVEEPADFCWAQSSLASRMIVTSVALKEALQELEWWGEALNLSLTADEPHVRMTSKGQHGTCEIEFAASSEAVQEFECEKASAMSYRFTLVATVFKALSLSEKACLRVNEAGMLSMQLMIKDETAVTTFVE